MELTIVMFIVALFLGGMLLPLSAQQDIRNSGDTQKALAEARDSLLGFAMANDRLPCPASATSNGVESFCDNTIDTDPCTVTTPLQYRSHGRCSNHYDGFLPAATLGLTPVDTQGYLIDGWGSESVHRVRYAVSKANSYSFTIAMGMKTTGMATLAPDLQICSTGIGMVTTTADTATCATDKGFSTDAVAVVYSLGKNAGTSGTGDEEKHNPNPQTAVAADRAFVSAPQGTAFDDQVLWLSKNTLFNRLVASGRLP